LNLLDNAIYMTAMFCTVLSPKQQARLFHRRWVIKDKQVRGPRISAYFGTEVCLKFSRYEDTPAAI